MLAMFTDQSGLNMTAIITFLQDFFVE